MTGTGLGRYFRILLLPVLVFTAVACGGSDDDSASVDSSSTDASEAETDTTVDEITAAPTVSTSASAAATQPVLSIASSVPAVTDASAKPEPSKTIVVKDRAMETDIVELTVVQCTSPIDGTIKLTAADAKGGQITFSLITGSGAFTLTGIDELNAGSSGPATATSSSDGSTIVDFDPGLEFAIVC